MAGLLLKNRIKLSVAAIPPHVLEYVKANIFATIGDSVQMIRNTVGTVIDTLLIELGPANWPEALSTLIELIDSPERFVQEVCILLRYDPREEWLDQYGGNLLFLRASTGSLWHAG